MPTNTQRFIGAIASIGITIGGAWLASTISTRADAQTSFTNGIKITFNEIRNDTGNIIVMVFDDRDAYQAYDATKVVVYREVPAMQGSVNVEFSYLKSGPYAVVAFHDEDGNQDLNMDGDLPTEGYATSGATDAFDLPTFARASLGKDDVSITMYYAN